MHESGKTPQELVSTGLIQFDAMDGNILPHLCMSGKNQCCVFLNEQGRCSIHDFRPGFCRLFPLGRFYENGGFKYFLQIHECKKTSRSKIKVKKWIDTPDLRQYEKFVADWHYFLLDVQEVLYNATDAQLIKNLNLYVVNRFYMKTYEVGRDFYEQFEERLTEGKHLSLFEKSYRKFFQTRSRAPGSLLFLDCSIPLEALGGTMVSAH